MHPSLPLSLYIHMPWCVQKCPYCDFNSHKSPDTLPEAEYIDALIDDLKSDLIQFPNQRTVESIFIGGGTPSLFSADAYHTLLNAVNALLPFARDVEITLEANPGTVEQQRFMDYRALGINRLSLGIQSFNPKHLQSLGRIHNGEQAHQAIKAAKRAGFENINLDIMHSLPHQTVEEGLWDLRFAINHDPAHVSWYELTIEPNTLFYKHPPEQPSEDAACELEEQGFALLKQHQYHRYEISAFSKSGQSARHNLNYWLFGDYYGIGAGAHGKITEMNHTAVHRTRKHRQPSDYLNREKPFLAASTAISRSDRTFEFMLNTTRLEQPIPHALFNERTGLSLNDLMPTLQIAKTKGLITLTNTHWCITPLGRQYTNDLQALFLASSTDTLINSSN